MKTPEQVVTDFVSMWHEPGGFVASMAAYFTDDTVYENVGRNTTIGIAEAVAFGETVEAMLAGGFLHGETLASATIGNRVLNERIDHLIDGEGKTLFSIRVMGTFEIQGEKIVAWRDYFDTLGLQQALAEND